ncbi:MAG: hypothetical protein WCH34_18055 [Bacteroidota bacterium]
MKKQLHFIAMGLVALLFVACGPTKKDIIKYNDDIVFEQKAVINEEKTILGLASKLDTVNIDKEYTKFKDAINSAIDKVGKLNEVDKDVSLKEAALKLFEAYKNVAENEYKEVVRITKIPTALYTPEEETKYKNVSKLIDQKLNYELKNFLDVQKRLAEKHKFELTK